MSDFYHSDLTDGTAQPERFPDALRPGYFSPDEMGLQRLLVLGKQLAANLKYFDTHNNEAGTWDQLFAGDPAFILADIATTDTARLEARYRYSIAQHSIEARVDLIEEVAETIDGWARALRAAEQPQIAPISKRIDQAIRNSLAGRVVGIRQMLTTGERPPPTRFAGLGSVWQAETDNSSPAGLPLATKRDAVEKLLFIDKSFHRFLGTIAYVKKIAAEGIDPDAGPRNQNPAVSLFIAFLRLYAQAQQTINRFPAKRLDFYYRQLLKVMPRSRQPDTVNLALTLAPGQPPVVVPKGIQFLAGKDKTDADIVFASDDDLLLTDARVRSVRTFCLEADPLISPQRELGCVTRIGADQFDPASEDEVSRSLFGAPGSATASDARIGLAIASPLLLLREGERKITLDLACETSASLGDILEEIALLADPESTAQHGNTDSAPRPTAAVSEAQRRRRFCRLLGQVFARESMSSSPWLSPQARQLVRTAAQRIFGESTDETEDHTGRNTDPGPLEVIEDLLAQDRTALFYRLLRDSFDLRLTAESGWMVRKDYSLSPLPDDGRGPAGGLRLELALSADAPAIVAYDKTVHEADFETDHPMVSLRLNANSMFFAYSLFAALDLTGVNLGVRVRGARALVAYNELGQLDSSKPFAPFGAQPSQDSYLAIGNFEAARKPLTQAQLNIEWGGLPRDFGGFQEYYRGYSADFDAEPPAIQTSVLAGGAWSARKAPIQPLFGTVEQTGQVASHCCLDLLQGRPFTALKTDVDELDYRLDNQTRSGFLRVDLSPTHDPFGHAEYPQLLTATLTANVKRRKPLPVPRPPYTPIINKLSLDYTAESQIRFRTERASDTVRGHDQLFQEHPFGARELAQSGREKPVPLVPRFNMDGYMLIGLSGSAPLGTVSLLFDLRGGEFRRIEQTIRHQWFYLQGNEFKKLSRDAIFRDTTANFSRSGIVTLSVPDTIDTRNQILPGDMYWFAIGASGDLRLCPRVQAVRTGAVSAVRQISGDDTIFATLPAGTIREAVSAPPGIGSIEQRGDSFGGRPAEDQGRVITRTAERLHHKGRACQPWDYERLTLERFPDLYKVKCFANMTTTHDGPAPGEVLIVVVPRVNKTGTNQAQRLLVNAVRLEEIRRFLQSRTSRFANVSVRNAVYELVQIRCSVKLAESTHGRYVRDLNQVISDFISPWRPGGYGASFGWRIRRKDIEACIGALDYVEFVTDFSMLHIVQDTETHYCLLDTARADRSANGSSAAHVERGIDEIGPRYPWSLALPSRRHFIQTMTEIKEVEAKPTGVNELEVGSTLILQKGHNHG